MSSRFSISLLITAIILLKLTAGPLSAASPVDPHNFLSYGIDCENCHRPASAASRGVMQKPVGEICAVAIITSSTLSGRLETGARCSPGHAPGCPGLVDRLHGICIPTMSVFSENMNSVKYFQASAIGRGKGSEK